MATPATARFETLSGGIFNCFIVTADAEKHAIELLPTSFKHPNTGITVRFKDEAAERVTTAMEEEGFLKQS